MKRSSAAFIIIAILIGAFLISLLVFAFSGANFQRSIKSWKSNYGGGLYRTISVYDYNGNLINSWTGQFDVSESENEVYFDYNNKRVIIHNGIVINEEIDRP